MRKALYIITAIGSLIFSGCVKDPVWQGLDGDTPEGKASLTLGLCLPESTPATKAMGDTFTFDPTVDKLRIAIFGSSGFLKEYVEATNVTLVQNAVAATMTTPGTPAIYSFKVTVSLNASAACAHVMINSPETLPFLSEAQTMQEAYSKDGKDAYWQKIFLTDTGTSAGSVIGITAKKEWNESTQSEEYVKDGDGNYLVSDAVQALFNPKHTSTVGSSSVDFYGIDMIRNYAKISVVTDIPTYKEGTVEYNNRFVLDPDHAIYVVNAPDRGSVAPYNTTAGKFVSGYGNLSYTDILQSTYHGFMPLSTGFDTSIPTDQSSFAPAADGKYIYERCKPQDGQNATYILVYGKFYAATSSGVSDVGEPCFYKIDLSDSHGYYTIFRNFRYWIKITGVAKKGSDTADEAANTGGSGDISSSDEVKDLDDISNGYCRILVQYTDTVLVDKTQSMVLKYKFLPDASTDVASNGADKVTITVNPGGTSGNVLASSMTDQPAGSVEGSAANGIAIRATDDENISADSQGWRSLTFDTTDPGQLTKTQVIRISGSGSGSTIYRDVTFRLMEMQHLQVTCQDPVTEKDEIEDAKGSDVDVKISIPKDLPRTMFPLEFMIESTASSITPRGSDNLPVSSGLSNTGSGKVAFHFIKTLSYAEYTDPSAIEGNRISFTCRFKTNRSESACDVYVSNTYFDTAHDPFTNYHTYDFSNLHFSNGKVTTSGTALTFNFDMVSGHVPSSVKVKLYGLENNGDSKLSAIIGEEDSYWLTTGGNTSISLNLKTSDATGLYMVSLSTSRMSDEHYRYAKLESDNYYGTVTIETNNGTFSRTGKRPPYSYDLTETNSPVTMTFASSNGIAWRDISSSSLSLSDDSVFTISSAKEITKIDIYYYAQNYHPDSVTTTPNGSYSESGDSGIWIPESGTSPTEVQFTLTKSSYFYYTRITRIIITYRN